MYFMMVSQYREDDPVGFAYVLLGLRVSSPGFHLDQVIFQQAKVDVFTTTRYAFRLTVLSFWRSSDSGSVS